MAGRSAGEGHRAPRPRRHGRRLRAPDLLPHVGAERRARLDGGGEPHRRWQCGRVAGRGPRGAGRQHAADDGQLPGHVRAAATRPRLRSAGGPRARLPRRGPGAGHLRAGPVADPDGAGPCCRRAAPAGGDVLRLWRQWQRAASGLGAAAGRRGHPHEPCQLSRHGPGQPGPGGRAAGHGHRCAMAGRSG
jgi:hypothetical protein